MGLGNWSTHYCNCKKNLKSLSLKQQSNKFAKVLCHTVNKSAVTTEMALVSTRIKIYQVESGEVKRL